MINMRTLIIHPHDPSTEVLNIVYSNIPNKTVITCGLTKSEIRQLIKSHDRIMMMGHGSSYGLFSVNQFGEDVDYIIDSSLVDELSKKENSVFIWCYASDFVKWHGLKGFSSGMFISEVEEANYCNVTPVTQETVDESTYGFCYMMAKYIDNQANVIYENVMDEYKKIAEHNIVAEYNIARLKIF